MLHSSLDTGTGDKRYIPAFRASAQTEPQVALGDDHVTLRIKAIYFDTLVGATAPRREVSPVDRNRVYFKDSSRISLDTNHIATNVIPDLAPILARSRHKIMPPSHPLSRLDRAGSAWRAVAEPSTVYDADRVKLEARLFELQLTYAAMSDSLVGCKGVSSLTTSSFRTEAHYRRDNLYGRSIFGTEHGFFGSAPHDYWNGHGEVSTSVGEPIRQGDVVVVPLGSRLPWILRKTEIEGALSLVVECEVPAIMDGALMKLVEEGKLEAKWFTIVCRRKTPRAQLHATMAFFSH